MRNYTILFLLLALVTGLTGFTGLKFDGVEYVRVLCLIFTDLFVVALFAKVLFPQENRMRYQRVEK